MKKRLFFYLFIIVTILILVFAFLTPAPVGKVTKNDLDQYLHINKYVKESLESDFCGSLPLQNQVSADNSTYHYSYECALFGSPNFVIYLKTEYEDIRKFENEIQRIELLAKNTMPINNGKILYVVNNISNDTLSAYFDTVINDGTSFVFEMIIVDCNSNEIEYLSALQQDEHEKDDIIYKFLEPLMSTKAS